MTHYARRKDSNHNAITCARSSQNGIDSFKQYLWRTYYATRGELTA